MAPWLGGFLTLDLWVAGEWVDRSGRAHGLRRAQGVHRLPHHQDSALARRPLRPQGEMRSDLLLLLFPFSICAFFSPGFSVVDPPDLCFFFCFDPVAVQRVRDPVPEEETGGAGARRRRGRRGAAGEEEEQEGERGGGDHGAPHGGVREGGGPEAAAADAAEETPRRGGEGGHPPHGPLLRSHLRLNHHPTYLPT
ncbi:hypothetical protein EE612_021462 [Oryza sativa]|uniref:Expressed protein n=1 Tax=Oryza sativa subsp. japonica TaxID=39947 RepID=Q10B39_ORYSJ|nr:expressed protein [Oryza sativa Japonica Group]KAB8094322.1 hypothetical protein EE612_021462 [Oryza sativa]BAG88976.1 unnamed protein product [Oryza sativa Japonica Group]